MTNSIVKLLVPLGERPLIFSHWLPFAEDALVIPGTADSLKVRLWVDMDCLGIGGVERDDISRHVNLLVGKLHVEVYLGQVDDSLVQLIFSGLHSRKGVVPEGWTETELALERQYEELGELTFASAVNALHRLLEFAQVEMGQYWIKPLPHAENPHGFFIASGARLVSEHGRATRWNPPPHIQTISVRMEDDRRFITNDDWEHLSAFVHSTQRADLVRELLANAEALLDAAHSRASLVEAVVALEVAVGRFVSAPDSKSLGDDCRSLDLSGLPRLKEKLGLRGSLDVLLPLLIGEEVIPHGVMRGARQAVEARGNVVHSGQRLIPEDDVRLHVRNIRRMCEGLAALTLPPNKRINLTR